MGMPSGHRRGRQLSAAEADAAHRLGLNARVWAGSPSFEPGLSRVGVGINVVDWSLCCCLLCTCSSGFAAGFGTGPNGTTRSVTGLQAANHLGDKAARGT